MIKLEDIRIGSKVMVRGGFGGCKPELATVISLEEDIKHGEPGIGYKTEDGELHWAYLNQIDKVVEY